MEEEAGTSFKEILLNRRKNDEGVEVILEDFEMEEEEVLVRLGQICRM